MKSTLKNIAPKYKIKINDCTCLNIDVLLIYLISSKQKTGRTCFSIQKTQNNIYSDKNHRRLCVHAGVNPNAHWRLNVVDCQSKRHSTPNSFEVSQNASISQVNPAKASARTTLLLMVSPLKSPALYKDRRDCISVSAEREWWTPNPVSCPFRLSRPSWPLPLTCCIDKTWIITDSSKI